MAHTLFNGYNVFFVPAADVVTTALSLLARAESSPSSATLLAARTHETMITLQQHLAIIATCVDKLVARTCGTPAQGWGYFDDGLTTYVALRARLEAAVALLKNADKDVVNARVASGGLMLPNGDGGEDEVPLHVYVSSFNVSYLYFHLVTAYNILRKEGVELGKKDYMVCFNETLGGKPLLWKE
ncbi:hypothetical protein PWT90_08467 [Aphanocladium album]|nr:hypothetical protein PWT90_08467 [Aphanocladium album]